MITDNAAAVLYVVGMKLWVEIHIYIRYAYGHTHTHIDSSKHTRIYSIDLKLYRKGH